MHQWKVKPLSAPIWVYPKDHKQTQYDCHIGCTKTSVYCHHINCRFIFFFVTTCWCCCWYQCNAALLFYQWTTKIKISSITAFIKRIKLPWSGVGPDKLLHDTFKLDKLSWISWGGTWALNLMWEKSKLSHHFYIRKALRYELWDR